MATQRKRIGAWMASGLLLAAVGCGFPHGRYGGDPMLGQFNRPIAPTPPIWLGGDPGVSPGWDTGVRMGIPSPDVPARSNPTLERIFIMPTFNGKIGMGNLFSDRSGGLERTQGTATPAATRRPAVVAFGAQPLPSSPVANGTPMLLTPMHASANAVTPRPFDTHAMLTSGTAFEPPPLAPKPISPVANMKDPRSVFSVEEGQTILLTCGAKSMMMDSQPTGEWRFTCTVANGGDIRRYEAKSSEQIEAVRAVLWQVKNER